MSGVDAVEARRKRREWLEDELGQIVQRFHELRAKIDLKDEYHTTELMADVDITEEAIRSITTMMLSAFG